jgi:hypothetical protein
MKNRFKLLIISLLACFVGGLRDQFATANVESVVGTHKVLSLQAEGAHVDTHLLVSWGSDAFHIVPCTNAFPFGTTTDNPAEAGDIINVHPLGIGMETRKVRVATALAAEIALYSGGANGYAQGEPTGAGTYWRIGSSVCAAAETAAGDYLIEFTPCYPVKVVVIAALTSQTTAAATDLPSSEALANALKADLGALTTALASPAELKII